MSTTLEQASRQLTNFSVGDAELRTILDRRFPGRGREILALYRRYYPDRPAFLLQAQAITDAGPRRAALHQAELKAAQGKGAIYVYEWDSPSPGADSRYGAARGLDAPGSLGNVVQPGSGRVGQRRHRQSGPAGEVGHQRRLTSGAAGRRDADARRGPVDVQELEGLQEGLDVVHAGDAEPGEEGVDHDVGVGQ